MNTDTHKLAQTNDLDEELRSRCPAWMKLGVKAVADARLISEADILREAVAEYLARRNVSRQPQTQEVAA